MKYIYFLLVLFVGLAVTQADERCMQPIESGRCNGYFVRYAYDVETQQCKEFIYGGCQGNENRFDSMQECKTKCES